MYLPTTTADTNAEKSSSILFAVLPEPGIVLRRAQPIKEFFEALNEVFVVFHDDENVLAALEVLHKELNMPGRLFDNLVKLFRAINRNLGIEYKSLTDDFMLRPFTPPVQVPHNKAAQLGPPPPSAAP